MIIPGMKNRFRLNQVERNPFEKMCVAVTSLIMNL